MQLVTLGAVTRALRSLRFVAAAGLFLLWGAGALVLALWFSSRVRDWSVMTDELQIIEIQGTAGASATVDRHNGFAEILENYPNLKVVAEQTAARIQKATAKRRKRRSRESFQNLRKWRPAMR